MSHKLYGPKTCCVCGETKPRSEYRKTGGRCNKCNNISKLNRGYIRGLHQPMDRNKTCALWLGVHITETALSKFFDVFTKMPACNPGYDYICGKGFKIDVKSSCIRRNPYKTTAYEYWKFHTDGNKMPDYFLCVGLDNRVNISILHVWLIPQSVVDNKVSFTVTNSSKILRKWEKYEQPLDRVIDPKTFV